MSLDKIQLPDFLLAEMYKETIVQLENSEATIRKPVATAIPNPTDKEAVNQTTPLTYLGENKQQVLVLVNEKAAKFATDEDLLFLTNILKACHLTLADIAILNLQTQPVTHQQLKAELNSKKVLLFDVETTAIHLPFVVPDFQPQEYAGVRYVKAPSLSAINNDTSIKRKLWESLQKLFDLKK